jgi:tripartite ATP-independent transporter DctP family solute receptor
MKQERLVLVLLLSVVLLFAVSTESATDQTEVTAKLRYATEVPELPLERYEAAGDNVFVNYLQQYGNIEVSFYPGGQLGDQISAYEQVRRGQLDISGIASSIVAGTDYPNLYIFDIPYLFPDPGIAMQVLHPNGRLVSELRADMIKKNGVRILAAVPAGYRHLTNSRKPVKTPADLRGLKIRTMNAPAHIRAWEAAGANPTPMSFAEVYNALQTGVIDGQENPIPVILGNSLNEVQEYLTLSRHVVSVVLLVMNEKSYQRLSPTQQMHVDRASELYYWSQVTNGEMHTNLQIKRIRDNKLFEVYNPTAAEIEEFRKVMQPAARQFIETQIEDQRFLDILFEEIEKAESYMK